MRLVHPTLGKTALDDCAHLINEKPEAQGHSVVRVSPVQSVLEVPVMEPAWPEVLMPVEADWWV